MGELLKAALLGVVEGVTEFLPVSSTGHLLVAADLLRFERSAGGTFEIFIQFGAVLALLAYYGRELLAQARALRRDASVRYLWLCVGVAFLPAAVVGLALRNWIKDVLFASPALIAWALIVGGVVFVLVHRRPRPAAAIVRAGTLTLRQAVAVGLAQVLALVPGVSRSGASIVGGMAVGLDRATATRFSFLLALPTLGAATLFDLLRSLPLLGADDAVLLAGGTAFATAVAFASIGWLLRYVQRHSFVPFGVYRICAGLLVLALLQAGVL
ncbi:MAG TPA: undecaprenyl-diphosphate phosphatase [Chloroflexota bacterium]|jgi:undecaprenyl-diphosphatase|nr:undecaprenyl-diphosphate phosphatase [Chloroflexota bacterium]